MTNIQIAGLALMAVPIVGLYILCVRAEGWRYATIMFGSATLAVSFVAVGRAMFRHGGA